MGEEAKLPCPLQARAKPEKGRRSDLVTLRRTRATNTDREHRPPIGLAQNRIIQSVSCEIWGNETKGCIKQLKGTVL